MKTINIIAISVCLLVDSLAAEESRVTKPNIIVMMVDDLGSGDVSCLFRNVVKTPNIDRLAQTGVKFTAGYVTAPVCAPSRAGMFSGVYQQRYGFIDNGGTIPADQPLFPGVLRDAGYRTALLGKWHSKGPMPHERGCFDETLCSPTPSPFIDYYHPKLARNGTIENSDEYSTDFFAREAEAFIERNKENPFALTVTFNAPHILKVVQNANQIAKAYDAACAAGQRMDVPKEPMARPGEAAKYADQFPGDTARADTVACIVALDEAVGRILDKLQQTGLEKKTIVFFTADNGGHPENRSENLPLRNYKWTLYEGGIRVPFFAAYPGVFPAGLVFDHPVSTLDIFPTCAALAGAKAPENLDGVNLMPYLTGEKGTPPHKTLYFGVKGVGGGYHGAIRQGPWKLLLFNGENPQLFNLSTDVEEKNDLAASEPALVQELTANWEKWQAQMPTRRERPAKDKKSADTEESE